MKKLTQELSKNVYLKDLKIGINVETTMDDEATNKKLLSPMWPKGKEAMVILDTCVTWSHEITVFQQELSLYRNVAISKDIAKEGRHKGNK